MLVMPIALPAILYIILSLPSVQNSIGERAEKELTNLLGTQVSIGEVSYSPFNRITLSDVKVCDDNGADALNVEHLGAGVSIFESLWQKKIVVTYAEFIGLNLNLYRDSVDAPLNIQPIIARLKKDDGKEPSRFDVAVNMVVIRRSSLTYNVNDAPAADHDKFDKNHIFVSDIRADIQAPVIRNNDFEVVVRRLAAAERSGIMLNDFSSVFKLDSMSASVSGLSVITPRSALKLSDIELISPLSKEFSLSTALKSPVSVLKGSYITLSELSPFVGILKEMDSTFDIEFMADGSFDDLEISKIDIADRTLDLWIKGSGHVHDLTKGKDRISFNLDRFDVGANLPAISDFFNTISNDYSNSSNSSTYKNISLDRLAPLGLVNITGKVSGSPSTLDYSGQLFTDCGNASIDFGLMKVDKNSPVKVDGTLSCDSFDPSLLDKSLTKLTNISIESIFDLAFAPNGEINGTLDFDLPNVEYNGYNLTDIKGGASFGGNTVDCELTSSSPVMDFAIKGGGELRGIAPRTEVFAKINKLYLAPFITGPYQDFTLSLEGDASLNGRDIDCLTGWLNIKDLNFNETDGSRSLSIQSIEIESNYTDSIRSITLHSNPIDTEIKGNFSFAKLPNEITNMIAQVYPAIVRPKEIPFDPSSALTMKMTMKEDTMLSRFFKLPVDIIYPITLDADLNTIEGLATLNLDAPYLRQKNKLIEGTKLQAILNAKADTSNLSFSTIMPTKNGMMSLTLNSGGDSDSIDTSIDWSIDRAKDFHGKLSFLTTFSRRDDEQGLITDIDFKSTQMVFNDSAWYITPGHIGITPGRIRVDGVGGERAEQTLSINGVAATDSIEHLVISLNQIDLDYLFETLNISDAVMFGGRATGVFYGAALLSKEPILYTPRLSVESLKYNYCEMGDGLIKSYWDNSTKSISIDAVITQRNGKRSMIDGYIRPLTEELDFEFHADKAPIGFMLPFMSAFTSKISGYVTGGAHLFGTFKDLDMKGSIFVGDLSMKLDFTNTTYTTSSPVYINPGKISFNNVELKDQYGNTAQLDGYVTHEFFHNPTFQFKVTKAKDLLVYDVNENITEDPWYGKIFGSGSATVTGAPGTVDIGVTMTTAPKSTFTFVLSDAENATEYDFITLRDRDAAKKDSIAALTAPPLIVRQLKERIQKVEEHPSLYTMEFNVDITPAATMNLIMDPIGGDKIIANGSGHLRMTYSSDGDLRMYGDYTLQRGSYNFTLQDIIIKDFTIKEGSKISFLGDPYAAQLNIEAGYTVNANLSDLDESFLEDKELNRTNVPVEALLKVRGDMRQPDLSFDLNFPTLTRDTYRKVRSIVSTEDMMNRQIIYLLALNRFYTPDYMNTTHGNELVSVASSTISSRLGTMLGQLSDNWSIAPNIRSDRGDFSDVEVDVALSSHLLNNRLLFNGNFGYRDKSLNNNSFIGDFDIRYLLNRAGTIQLKAYNRYNDQNYYLKSALTTQGVGIVFKRDFDNIFSFLRKLKKQDSKETPKDKNDSIPNNVPYSNNTPDSITDGATDNPDKSPTDSGTRENGNMIIFRNRE